MNGTYVPPRRTPFTPRELAQAYEYALGGDGKVGAPLIAVLMAHCALETGRDVKAGLIGPSCWNYNLGNVKAAPSWQGLYTCIRLNEYLLRGGKRTLVWFSPEGEEPLGAERCAVPPGHPQTRMRAFVSLEEGARAKLNFLHAPRFRFAMEAAQRGDPSSYVNAIHAQKYFTADLVPYRNAVVSLYKSYLPVAQQIAQEPAQLPEAEESSIASLTPHVALLPLEPDWEAMRRDRDMEIRRS